MKLADATIHVTRQIGCDCILWAAYWPNARPPVCLRSDAVCLFLFDLAALRGMIPGTHPPLKGDPRLTKEMAIRGTHARVIEIMSEALDIHAGQTVLDIGAGAGALSERLRQQGLSVSACDLFPEQFNVPGITCKPCDESGALPVPDASFDLATAVEVLEHIDGHRQFFAEASRILKPGGALVFTTPNILSLKSRLLFLFTGTYYSFKLLTPFTKDPVGQHISPFTLNRYEWMLSQHAMRLQHVGTDKAQGSSRLLAFLLPFIKVAQLRSAESALARKQNSWTVLFGRKLVVIARKESSGDRKDVATTQWSQRGE